VPYGAYDSASAADALSPQLVRALSPRARRRADQRAAEMEMEDDEMFQL
jgi:hypothetical protein